MAGWVLALVMLVADCFYAFKWIAFFNIKFPLLFFLNNGHSPLS
jgi:hypothetical protein